MPNVATRKIKNVVYQYNNPKLWTTNNCLIGNYNNVENTLNFVEAPYGTLPMSSTTNPPDSRDWVGIATGSHFQGRSFMRSGIPNTAQETYARNYVFDDISSGFTGTERDFVLTSAGGTVTGIETPVSIN